MPEANIDPYLSMIDSRLVTLATRSALQKRMRQESHAYNPKCFLPTEYAAISAVCARLIGEPQGKDLPTSWATAFIAREIDRRLFHRKTDGWRYDALPSDADAYRQGIALLEQAASEKYGDGIAALDATQLDELLSAAEAGKLRFSSSTPFDTALWFEELLAEAVECFYSLPEALREIGYVGFADAQGWQRVGMNELEPREAASATRQ